MRDKTKDMNFSGLSFRVIGLIGIKFLLTLVIIYLIYREVYVERDVKTLIDTFLSAYDPSHAVFLIGVLLLMPFNWVAESIKWQKLTRPFTELTWVQSLKMILVGLTFGIITPARVGEYGGRFYMMTPGHRWKTISAMFVGSLAQNIVTGFVGMGGAIFLIYNSSALQEYLAASYFYLVGFLVTIGLLVFYRIPVLQHFAELIPVKSWAINIKRHSHYLTRMRLSVLNMVLGLAALRYLIYGFQYYLLLKYFGVQVEFWEASAIIALLFLIQSGLPLPPMLNVMARGEIAILVWTLFTDNTLAILATTFGLWFINLIIPAVIGLILFIKNKISTRLTP